jgi:NADH-quinone oxidoreductase subunit L
MAIPLVILAILSLVGGLIGLPEVSHMPNYLAEFLQPVLLPGQSMAAIAKTAHKISHSEEWMVMGVSVVVSLAGIIFAYVTYLSGKAVPSDEAPVNSIHKLVSSKFYFDEIYEALVLKPIALIANLFSVLIDLLFVNLIVEGFGALARFAGGGLRLTQAGRVSGYALIMLISIVVFALAFIFRIF